MPRVKSQEFSEKVLLDLIGKIYDAAIDRSSWQGVLASIADAMSAPHALLLSPTQAPEDGGTWAFRELSPDMLRPYMEHFIHRDLWHQIALKRGIEFGGRVITGEELIDDRNLFKSEFYNDYLRQMGMFRLCSTIIHDGAEHGVPNVNLSLYRSKSQAPFSDDAIRMMRLLYPHLKRALSINYRLMALERQSDSVVRATEQINEGAVVVNEACQAIFVNGVADRLLAKSGQVRLQNGTVEIGNPVENARFRMLISEACDPINKITRSNPNVMTVAASENARKLRLTVCPTDVPFLAARSPKAHAIIFISEEHEAVEDTVEIVAKRHQLTRAEVRVLKGIIEGLPIKSIAARLGVSANTVHTQINSIYSKTNTHRQSELMKLVMMHNKT